MKDVEKHIEETSRKYQFMVDLLITQFITKDMFINILLFIINIINTYIV